MKLIAYNPSTDNLEKSYLSNSYAVGSTTLVVRNSNRFTTNCRILLGDMGYEESEIVTVSNVNADGMTLIVGATKFPHSADDAVYVLPYDQIKFYRSTTTVDGTYSVLATVDVDVDNADKQTYYDDTSGLPVYFYKLSFYHSVATTESSLSDPIPGTGYTRLQLGSILNDFLTEVGDLDQQYMNIPQAISVLNECNDDLSTQSKRPYRFLKTSQSLSITGGSNRVALPDTLMKFDRLAYTYDFSTTNRTDNIDVLDIEEIEYLDYDNTAQTSNDLDRVAIDESTSELVLFPTPTDDQADAFKVYFWKKFNDFTSLGDTIETPTPRIYKLFLASRFYRMRSLHDESYLPLADRYAADYNTEVVKMQRSNRIDIGTPQGYRPDVRTARGLRKR